MSSLRIPPVRGGIALVQFQIIPNYHKVQIITLKSSSLYWVFNFHQFMALTKVKTVEPKTTCVIKYIQLKFYI